MLFREPVAHYCIIISAISSSKKCCWSYTRLHYNKQITCASSLVVHIFKCAQWRATLSYYLTLNLSVCLFLFLYIYIHIYIYIYIKRERERKREPDRLIKRKGGRNSFLYFIHSLLSFHVFLIFDSLDFLSSTLGFGMKINKCG